MAKNANRTPDTNNKNNIRFIERGFMPAVVLTLIAIVSIALLALTEYSTADARAYQVQYMEDINKRSIFTEADNFPAEELDNAGASLEGGTPVDLTGDGSIIDEVYLVEKDGNTVGILVTAKPLGYGGRLVQMLGYDLEGNLVGMTIDAQSQTAGLGTKVGEEAFMQQLSGFNASDTVSSSDDASFKVDGISGATISAEAAFKGINAANMAAKQILGLD